MIKPLFLHVPRTSGTSLTAFLRARIPQFVVQANAPSQLGSDPHFERVRDIDDVRRILEARGGLALHVDAGFGAERRTGDFRSLAHLVFDDAHASWFARFAILTMLREPFASFLSTYRFVRATKLADPSFLPDLDVDSLEAYLEAVHDNAVLHFLLEPQLARRRIVTRDELDRVKRCIAQYPIHVGIYERHAESVEYYGRVLGRTFPPRDVPVLNAGTIAVEAGPTLEAAFRERNALDLELYAFATTIFDQRLRTARAHAAPSAR